MGPGGPNGAQEAPWVIWRSKMESRRLSWNLGDTDRAQEAQTILHDAYHIGYDMTHLITHWLWVRYSIVCFWLG